MFLVTHEAVRGMIERKKGVILNVGLARRAPPT